MSDPLGHHAERRARVELLHDPERGGAGDLVAGPDRVLDGRRAAPGGQRREVQVHPAVDGDVERRLRQQRAVRDHRAAVGPQGAQLLLELGVARVGGCEHRDPELRGALGHRARRQPASTAGGGVGPGDDADELVAGRGDGVQDGYGDLGGASEDDAHAQRPSPLVACGDTFTMGASRPNHSDSRIAFIAALRASTSSRSRNSTPSRWSVSC